MENFNNQDLTNFTSLKRKKPEFKEEELGINPFLNTLKLKARHYRKSNKLLKLDNVKLEDDIVTIGKTITNEDVYLVEKHEKVSVYTESALRLHIHGMSSKAKSLLFWIMYEADYGKDYMWINVQRYLLETDSSLNTYKTALIELNRNAILMPILGLTNMFWINPIFFFKGNRLTKYKSNIEIES
jgi:hypothetical protein